MMLFEIRNLTKTYGERTVLDIPELDFEKGTVYALLGPNGSGKTTLLEILSLLSPPTTGEITYANRPVDFSRNHLVALRREVILVHQNAILFSTSVYKNLEFGLKIRGISKKERGKRIDEALELVGMRSFIDAEAHRLSGGETQRVAIARALACSPKALFFDEPTSNVDTENQNAIERIIEDINTQKNISIIFTTHNIVQAARLSQRIVSLFEGRKVPAVFENIFSGRVLESQNGLKTCLILDRVPLILRSEKSGPIRLCIDPLMVELSGTGSPDPEKNVFKGRLTQLTDENEFVRAVVDIGIPLNALVPKATFESSMIIGSEVQVSCPPSAIQVF